MQIVVVEVVYTVLLEAGLDAGTGTPCTSDEGAVVAGAGPVPVAVDEDAEDWTCVSGKSVEGSGAAVLEEALECGAAAVVAGV